MLLRCLLLVLTCIIVAPRVLPAQTAMSLGTWYRFGWFDGLGAIDDPADGFLLTTTRPVVVRLTDAYDTGDAFTLFVNGTAAFSTPGMMPGVTTGAGTGDAAWADPRLSRGSVQLAAGTYRLDVVLREDAGFGFGDGFLRADPTVVPEPGTMLLVAGGLALVGGVARRRRAPRGTPPARAPARAVDRAAAPQSRTGAVVRMAVAFVAAVAMWGCGEAPSSPTQVSTSGALLEVTDGGRNGGTAGFYFLAPVAPALATYPGTFDAGRSPVVEVCRMVGGACAQPAVATYTVGGPAGADVHVLAAQQHYRADWSLAGVQRGAAYRVRVLLNGAELGHADAKMPAAGESPAQVIAQGYVPLGNGGSLPIRFRLETSLPGQPATTIVGPGGGTVTVPGVGSAVFPSGFFKGATPVQLLRTADPKALATFQDLAFLFRVSSSTSEQTRLVTDTIVPAGDTYDVTVPVPATLTIAAGQRPELFAQVYEDAGMEVLDNFQLMPSSYDPVAHTLTATLPLYTLTNDRRADRRFEAVFMIGVTPGGGVASSRAARPSRLALPTATAAATCDAAFIGRPVPDGIPVTDSYGPRPKHPVTGKPAFHWGTDFGAPTGTTVSAVADGTVERIWNSTTYGQVMVIRHTDGAATLYAHLKTTSVTVGSAVSRGTAIATSDGAKGAPTAGTSSGPHLHFEYVPNGQIVQSKQRIDPFPCIQDQNASGSITVRDNGFIADDAFAVYLDGVLIGETDIGGSNSIALNNIRPGQHQLRLVITVAPDDAGTWEIVLGDGLYFDAPGDDYRSDYGPEGSAVDFTITVPSQQSSARLRSAAPISRPNRYVERKRK